MINLQETTKYLPVYIIVILISGITWLALQNNKIILENREYFKRMVVYQDSICDKRLREQAVTIDVLRSNNKYLLEKLSKCEAHNYETRR